MNTFARLVFCFAFVAASSLCHAQLKSPADLTADIDLLAGGLYTDFAPYPFFGSETQIVNAFNYARRKEEIQFSLAVNSLGSLTLPANYTSKTAAQRALYLINQERIARAGANYGSGAVGGLPLDAVENNLSAIAQGHANDMATNKFFGHTGTNGQSPYQRINASTTYGGTCNQFMTYAENIYISCGSSATSSTYLIEQAIYGWIYQDSGSAWGHRRAIMIQGADDNSGTGYTNDRGLATSEGFLGIGISSTSSFTASPCGSAFPNAQFVVMMVVDPSPTAACESKYSVQASALPVNLLFFSAVSRQQEAVLSWATAWEQENSGFSILKSTDALGWESVGSVLGNGTQDSRHYYTFTDADVRPGRVYYYKLRQQDFTGQTNDSRAVAVTINALVDEFYLYPNPSADGSFRLVAGQESNLTVSLSTLTGATIPTQSTASAGEISVRPTQSLPTGLYQVRVSDTTGQQRVLRLLVGGSPTN